MTDNRETPASTGSQRGTSSRSTTKRSSTAKNATTAAEEPTIKAPARKRAAGSATPRRAPKIEAADVAPVSRANAEKASARSMADKPMSATQPSVPDADSQDEWSTQPSPSSGSEARRDISSAERRDMIQRIAYFRAQWRGWTPGAELDDWLHAEREVDAILRGDRSA